MNLVDTRRHRRAVLSFLVLLSATPLHGSAQVLRPLADPLSPTGSAPPPSAPQSNRAVGGSSADLVRRALASNADLAATRLDIDRARSRLRQAGAIPNPTVQYQQTTGRFTGSQGEWERAIVVALPVEIAGQRGRRRDLAKIELEAATAALADAERRLAVEVRNVYADVIAAERELATTTELDRIDTETARFVQVRVGEGESSPLELNLLKAEIDRQRSRRALVTGQRDAAIVRLKAVAGAAPDEFLQATEDLKVSLRLQTPPTVQEAVVMALDTRPDVRLARLEEQAAEAGYKLVRSQSAPEVTVLGGFGVGQSVFDDTPVGTLLDRDKVLSFGVSVSIPIFNRNQGARAEAATMIAQARKHRESVERQVRAEVAAAFARYRAATEAAATYESGVLDRSRTNVESIRGAYQAGAFRITEFLAEQRRLADSEREFTQALAERYRALADLESAVGIAMPAEFTAIAPPQTRAAAIPAPTYPGFEPQPASPGPAQIPERTPVVPVVETIEDEDAQPGTRGPK
ncbi:MAG TPA: TolC family protein [Blastocatellia bacterium]|nr:TolC family protein [Blastocatellia bacterium]